MARHSHEGLRSADRFRHKAEDLLHRASETVDMTVRGRLVDEAMRWHTRAMDAAGHGDDPEDDQDGEEPLG